MIVALLMGLVTFTAAQDEETGIPQAEVINDEGGVQLITGEVEYTVGFLTDFNRGAMNIALVNQALYVDRDFEGKTPISWQVLGEVLTDPFVSPFEYELNLPIMPRGPLRDLSGGDGEGVAVFGVMGYTNFRGTPYWESELEYTTGFTSYQTTREFELRYDIVGGKLLVWAPDYNQVFPSGFGEDRMLFTEDDPMMRIPAGWSVVNLDTEPFTLDRSATAIVDLIEQEQSLQPYDFSDLSYVEAFEELMERLRREYAFTEYKGIDWDAIYEEFLPRFEQATEDNDAVAYQFTMQDFVWAIPDGHIGASLPLTNDAFFRETDGGLGLAVRELDDGRILANFVLQGGPAAEAGMELGAELTAINGAPPLDRADKINIWAAPFSADHSRRIQELRYITRFETGEEVELSFINPESEEEQTVTVTAINERQSWSFSSVLRGAAGSDAQPITFEVLDSGYAYVRINSFSQYPELMFRIWEWIIDQLNDQNIPGLILDMRWNSGGYNLDRWLTGYFFEERRVIGNRAIYYTDIDEFFIDPLQVEEIIPPDDGRFYGGPIALLVSPACASACEFFSYNMTIDDRATVIGFYPSDGLGGNIKPVFMPDNVYFQFTVGRALTADGEIRLEGLGVQPDILVPVTEETLFSDDDVLLQTAIDHLDGATTIVFTSAGEITVGETVEAELVRGERVRFDFVTPDEGGLFDVVVSSDDPGLDTVLYIYLANDLSAPVLENDDDEELGLLTSAIRELEIPGGLPLVFEVGGFMDNDAGIFTITITPSGADVEEVEEVEDAVEEAVEDADEAEEVEEAEEADDDEAEEVEETEETEETDDENDE
ncbi:MAG: hypothetical protein EA396_11705 [Anaerolineaceae bacterium]|nr:MAG: hypothetical protein EA396_11705 [Anaerolineaceae bacterium]